MNDPQYMGTPIEKLHALYDQAIFEVDDIKRMELVWQMNEIHMTDGPFFLGTVCNTPRIIIISKNLITYPPASSSSWAASATPGSSRTRR